jgi:hypothetical protein
LTGNCKNNAISRFRSIKSTKLSPTGALLVGIIGVSEKIAVLSIFLLPFFKASIR